MILRAWSRGYVLLADDRRMFPVAWNIIASTSPSHAPPHFPQHAIHITIATTITPLLINAPAMASGPIPIFIRYLSWIVLAAGRDKAPHLQRLTPPNLINYCGTAGSRRDHAQRLFLGGGSIFRQHQAFRNLSIYARRFLPPSFPLHAAVENALGLPVIMDRSGECLRFALARLDIESIVCSTWLIPYLL